MAKKVKADSVIESNLSDIIGDITKDIKKDFQISKFEEDEFAEFLSTGNIGVDFAISGKSDGGFPIGRISELSGLNACLDGASIVTIEIDGDSPKDITVLETIELFKEGKKLRVNSAVGFQPITDWVFKGNLDALKVELENGSVIKVTPDHRFFTINEDGVNLDPTDTNSVIGYWIRARALEVGSEITTDKMKNEKVTKIEPIGKIDIYDLTVGHPSQCYFAEGFLNHNTGKSLLAQHALVETQNRQGVAILVDSEYAFNPEWFKVLGGKVDSLIHYEPEHIEDAYMFMEKTIESIRAKNKDIPITIVYDSVAASPSKHEVENGMLAYDMGKRAQAHGKGLRMLMGKCSKSKVTFIAINQLRSTYNKYGPELETVGGHAWKYAPSVRIRMKKGKIIEVKNSTGGKKVIGIGGGLKVEKNRYRAPFAQAEFNIYFKQGIDPVSGLFTVLKEDGVVEPRRNDEGGVVKGWWNYKGTNFRESEFDEILKANPDLLGGHKLLEGLEKDIEISEMGDDEDDRVSDANM